MDNSSNAKDIIKLLADTFEHINEAVVITDLKHNILWVNNSFEKRFGWSKEEITFSSFSINNIFKDQSHLEKNTEVSPVDKRVLNITKSGDEIPSLVRTTVFSDPTNTPIAYVSILEDLRDNKSELAAIKTTSDKTKNLIFIVNSDFKIEFINKTVLDTLQFSEKELMGDSVFNYLHVDQSGSKQFFDLASRKIENTILEVNANTKLGLSVWFNASFRSVKEDNREAYVVVCENITDKRKTEEALKKREEEFRNLFNNPSIGIYRTDKSGKLIEANATLIQMLGYRHIEEIPVDNFFFDHHVDPSQRKNFYSKLEENKQAKGRISEWKDKSGNSKLLKESIKVIEDNKSNILYIEGMVEDISNWKVADDARRRTEVYFRGIWENSLDGMRLIDENGTVILVNESYSKIFGKPKFDIVGKQYYEVYHDSIQDGIRDSFENHFKKGFVKPHFEEEFVLWDGRKLYLEVIHRYISIKNEEPVLFSVFRDITHRKEYENEIIKAREKAERSDQLKSEFLAQVSHEIRTPINTILNFISLLEEELFDYDLPSHLTQSFSVINNSSRRLIRTVDLILNMSEIQTGNFEILPEAFDLEREFSSKLMLEFKHLANKKGLEFKFVCNTADSMIYADVYTINQIFTNLLDNAIKFTEEGSISIFINDGENGMLETVVEDTGIGISDKYKANLFQAFSQEDSGYTRRYEGNGLGLALVKKYVDMNSAEINFESEKGKGTKFILTFPKQKK